MIFVTTGTQEPFDRLVQLMDEFAANCNEEIIVQTIGSNYPVKHIKVRGFIEPLEYQRIFEEARLVVSHAGMGTIISALTSSKPLIIFPRIAKLGEHRNEHQLATAKKFKELKYVRVAETEEDLLAILQKLLSNSKIDPLHKLDNYASSQIIDSLNSYINKPYNS